MRDWKKKIIKKISDSRGLATRPKNNNKLQYHERKISEAIFISAKQSEHRSIN